jgi:hypothetical protein
MSDGGMFPWKQQKLILRPTADYSKLQNPLPTPPEGMEWKQDESTREWRLAKKESQNKNNNFVPALLSELTVDSLPTERPATSSSVLQNDDEWEFLSDRVSASSAPVLVQKGGSVRSISSRDEGTSSNSLLSQHSTTMDKLVAFKFQRTHLSSTIDSCDNDTTPLGPSGKGVLGLDYVEHVVLPTDTFQGICLAYKCNSTRLRQANHFSGHSLQLAPKKLVIPLSKTAMRTGYIRVQDTDDKEYKLHFFLAEYPDLSMTEAKA